MLSFVIKKCIKLDIFTSVFRLLNRIDCTQSHIFFLYSTMQFISTD